MTYELILAALGFIAALMVVVKPIITLSNNITKLTMSVDQLNENFKDQKDRLDVQDGKIDTLNIKVADHETRITVLEK